MMFARGQCVFRSITPILIFVLCGISNYALSEDVNYLVVDEIAKPFQITHDGQSQGGIVSDIVDKIFEDSPYTIKRQTLPLNRLYSVIESGEVKNWIAYDSKVWNSLKMWRHLIDEPLFPVTHSFLTCQNGMHPPINSVDDIKQQRIAIIKGFDYPELEVLQKKNQLELVSVNNYTQGIKLTALNRVDGFAEMDLRLRFTIKNESISQPCLHFTDMSQIIPSYSIYLSADKNSNPALKNTPNLLSKLTPK
mgnify:CR=1 FL=1